MPSNKSPVYLDYHATTPVDERVLKAMLPYFDKWFGNAASRSHSYGWQANEGVEIARNQVANLLDVQSKDLVFTSGATEGLNMLIQGIAMANTKKGKHMITVSTEHHAVLDVMDWLGKNNYEVTVLPVNKEGILDPECLRREIRSDTILVSAMWANNETGVINDVATIGSICRAANVPLICDATQAMGKALVHPWAMNVDMIAFSAHKFYGPKGIGAVYINPSLSVKPFPLIHGGGHERGFRSGTLNVPAIVGMGEAARICNAEMNADTIRIQKLRDQLENTFLERLEETSVNGNVVNRLPTVSNLCVRLTDSQAVMTKFRSKLAIASGSACSSADPSPSHVLMAMGLSETDAKASYRFSLGRPTTEEEIKKAAAIFIDAVMEYRHESPLWAMHKEGIDISQHHRG